MTEFSRDDLNRLFGGIDDVRKAVTSSEIRLRQEIRDNRIESDAVYVRRADLEVVDQKLIAVDGKVDSLAEHVKGSGERKDNTRKIIIGQSVAIVGELLIFVLDKSGLFK